MESNQFDKQIREKLQNLKAKYRPEDWELMEQKLNGEAMENTPEFEDVLLDGIAFGSLENYKADYNPAHWELMEQKLDNAYWFRRKLYRYKVAEVSLMLLAIFTIIQFLPFKKQKTSNDPVAVESKIENVISHDFENTDRQSIAKNQSQPVDKESNITPENTDNLAALTNSSFSNKLPNSNTKKSLSQPAQIGLKITKKGTYNIIDGTPPSLKTNYFPLSYSDLLSGHFGINSSNTKQPISLLLPIDAHEPDKLSVANRNSGLADCPTCNTLTSPILISIGMSGSADADYITTPYDDQYHQTEYSQIAMGYSGGVTLGFKYHKWELETGAIYAAKYYGSRNIFEVNGSFEEGGYVQQGLLGVQLDIVKLPLHLRYNFMNQSKWNIYAHSGASFNMTVETLYEYTSQNIGDFSALTSRRGDPHSTSEYNGIFEGGNLIDNTFITANLGLGIERHFNSRMSVFVGSTYQHQISKGFGPQNDKINSLSIMAGARVTLKSNK